ncbi:MAG: hypothetical protein V8S71_08945 [Oscillospiraceae bacterium]
MLMGGALPFTNMQNLKTENHDDGGDHSTPGHDPRDSTTVIINSAYPTTQAEEQKLRKRRRGHRHCPGAVGQLPGSVLQADKQHIHSQPDLSGPRERLHPLRQPRKTEAQDRLHDP